MRQNDGARMAAETSPIDRAAAGRVGASGEAASEVRQELSRLMDQLARIKSAGLRSLKKGAEEPASSIQSPAAIQPVVMRPIAQEAHLGDDGKGGDSPAAVDLPSVVADVVVNDSSRSARSLLKENSLIPPLSEPSQTTQPAAAEEISVEEDIIRKKSALLKGNNPIMRSSLQVEQTLGELSQESRTWQLWTKAKWSALSQAQETIQQRKADERLHCDSNVRERRRSSLASVVQQAMQHRRTIRASQLSSLTQTVARAQSSLQENKYVAAYTRGIFAIDLMLLFSSIFVLYVPDLYLAANPPVHMDTGMYSIEFIIFLFLVFDIIMHVISHPRYFLSFYFWFDCLALLAIIPDLVYLFSSQLIMPNSRYLILARAARIGRVTTRTSRLMECLSRMQRMRRSLPLTSRQTRNENNDAARQVQGDAAEKPLWSADVMGRLRSQFKTSPNKPLKSHDMSLRTVSYQSNSTVGSGDVEEVTSCGVERLASATGRLASPTSSTENHSHQVPDSHETYIIDHDGVETEDEFYGRTPRNFTQSVRARLEATVNHHLVAISCLILVLCISLASLVNSDSASSAVLAHARSLGDLAVGLDWDLSHPLLLGVIGNLTNSSVDRDVNILYVEVGGVALFGSPDTLATYRPSFASEVVVTDFCCGDGSLRVHMDRSKEAMLASWYNVVIITGVLLIVPAVTASMVSSMKEDVIKPLEGISRTIDHLKDNPLTKIEQDLKMRRVSEIASVERTLVQLSSLLQMGFGEAGAQIIASSLDSDNALDITAAGKRVHAFFGFCDIRNFTDCTEVLQEEVVKMVNNVGLLVHDAVVANHGAPNKNIGDAFLLVWKPKSKDSVHVIAESALRSYLTTIIEMQRDAGLRVWAARPGIQKKLPGFTVKLGFGLHFGWAVECTIGSHHKVDASYLSPHVNLASRLEAATKQYGVSILISGETHQLFSRPVKKKCRYIDRVIVKGASNAMRLYTYDCPSLESCGGEIRDDVNLSTHVLDLQTFFDVIEPGPGCTHDFAKSWGLGMIAYLGGNDGRKADWHKAKACFQKCLQIRAGDGPATALLAYIEADSTPQGDAPPDWQGYRALTEK